MKKVILMFSVVALMFSCGTEAANVEVATEEVVEVVVDSAVVSDVDVSVEVEAVTEEVQ